MSSQVITFETFDLSGAEPEAWKRRVETLKSAEGIRRVFFGPVVEDSSKGVVAAQWASAPSAQDEGVLILDVQGSPDAVLEAPTTELFTAHGTTGAFFDNTVQFAAHMAADLPKRGFFGSAAGKNAGGDVVRLLLGWESPEAHNEAKSAPGSPIMAHIGLLRSGRESVNMVHVQFKEQ
ncbi:hypothetical protein GQ53DRAFT_751381 [Thozetella sp. PMI_491]|nr:hypothetical protein GQ53DRAFT_751381 [Thozetella sp. PMI_491]